MAVSVLITMINLLGSSLIFPPLNSKSNVIKICLAADICSDEKVPSCTAEENGLIVNGCNTNEPKCSDW